MDKLSDNLKKIFLAGIGAVAVTAEKSKDLLDEMVEKGELTVEQGKVLNEELKHNVKKTVKEKVNALKPASAEELSDLLDKMTPEQIAEVERLVNEAIEAKAPVICEEMGVEEAKAQGAIGLFGDKYGEKVRVYTMGGFSKEICGGPHAANTGDLEHFRIVKEESSSRGVRRIKAVIGK